MAGGLRFWGLGDLRPGLYRDEAIVGCQGLALLRGETLPHRFWAPFARWPLWNIPEAASLGLLGGTVFALRLPAALTGVAGVAAATAVLAGRFGAWPALLGGGTLAFSFWHLEYSRLSLPHILVVFQGILLMWLLLRLPAGSHGREGLATGLVAGTGLFSYYAGLHLLLVPVPALYVRWALDPASRPGTLRRAGGVAAGLVLACALGLLTLSTLRELGTGYRVGGAGEILRSLGGHLRALGLPTRPDPDVGFWGIYPPGGSFLSPTEALLCVCGLVVLLARRNERWIGVLAAGWVLAALVPAAATGETLRTSRSVGVLVPVALLAAAAGAGVARRFPRAAPALVAVVLAAQAGWTGWRYFGEYRRDPRVALWSDRIDTEGALALKDRAAVAPLVVASQIAYEFNPHLAFLLDREIRSGRIVHVPVGPDPAPSLEVVIRDPLQGQPALFLFRVRDIARPGSVALALVNPDGLLGAGDEALRAGRYGAAARHYRKVLAWIPDFGIGHVRLAMALEGMGDRGGAERERAEAIRLGIRK